MNLRILSGDKSRFATNLKANPEETSLIWDVSSGTDTLLVRTAFGVNAADELKKLEGTNLRLQAGTFTEVAAGVWLRQVTAVEKARNKGCEMEFRACTYSIFVMESDMEADEIRVFDNEDDGKKMIRPVFDVPLRISVKVQRDEAKKGMLFKRSTPTDFWRIGIKASGGGGESYVDGDLVFRLSEKTPEIPITKEMLKVGTFFVESPERCPAFSVRNKRVEISD